MLHAVALSMQRGVAIPMLGRGDRDQKANESLCVHDAFDIPCAELEIPRLGGK